MQRILPAETIAGPQFQAWLKEQNQGGADVFIGMNPMKDGIPNRTKENVREIRHVYLDLDEDAGASLHAVRTSGDAPSPNFVLDTSPGKHQVVWRVDGIEECLPDTAVNRKPTGPMRSGLSPAVTTPTKSSSASPTIAPTIKPILTTTPG